jgi:hypothetical protein
MPASFVLASFRPSTYRAYMRQSAYPLAGDRSERVKRSLVCTSSALHSLRPCPRSGASRRAGVGRVRIVAILSLLREQGVLRVVKRMR